MHCALRDKKKKKKTRKKPEPKRLCEQHVLSNLVSQFAVTNFWCRLAHCRHPAADALRKKWLLQGGRRHKQIKVLPVLPACLRQQNRFVIIFDLFTQSFVAVLVKPKKVCLESPAPEYQRHKWKPHVHRQQCCTNMNNILNTSPSTACTPLPARTPPHITKRRNNLCSCHVVVTFFYEHGQSPLMELMGTALTVVEREAAKGRLPIP